MDSALTCAVKGCALHKSLPAYGAWPASRVFLPGLAMLDSAAVLLALARPSLNSQQLAAAWLSTGCRVLLARRQRRAAGGRQPADLRRLPVGLPVQPHLQGVPLWLTAARLDQLRQRL